MSKFDLTVQNSILGELFRAKQVQVRALSDELEACHKLLGDDKYLPGEKLKHRIADLLDDQERASSVLALSRQNVEKLEATIANLDKDLSDSNKNFDETLKAFCRLNVFAGSLPERVKILGSRVSYHDYDLKTLLNDAGIKGDSLPDSVKELIRQRGLLKKELEGLNSIGRERNDLQVRLAEVTRQRDRLQSELELTLSKNQREAETRRNGWDVKTVRGGPTGFNQIGMVWEESDGNWTAHSAMLNIPMKGLKDERTARAILQGVDGRYSEPIKLALLQEGDGNISLTELQRVYHHGLSNHFRQLVHDRKPLLIEGFESSEVIQKWVLGGQRLMEIQFFFEEQGDE